MEVLPTLLISLPHTQVLSILRKAQLLANLTSHLLLISKADSQKLTLEFKT